FFSSRRRHTRFSRDWSSDVCSSDLLTVRYVLLLGLLCLTACAHTPPPQISQALAPGDAPLSEPLRQEARAQTPGHSGFHLLASKIGRASCRERVYNSADAEPVRK